MIVVLCVGVGSCGLVCVVVRASGMALVVESGWCCFLWCWLILVVVGGGWRSLTYVGCLEIGWGLLVLCFYCWQFLPGG